MSASGADIQPLEEDDPERLGNFPLIGRLGAGGMGRVYLGRSLGDGSLVAVKTLLAEGEISPTDRRRFAREVKVARRVQGLRTARVLGADAEAERPWMATEYVPAPSLAELVHRAGPLNGAAARWVTRGALEAVAELHGSGIVHRDVKPQNLLLPLGGPRLIDFGISHAADLTRTQLTLGTVAFTSPEQARGEPSTAASDIYSLGATLFHLAVGRAPYPPDIEMLPLLTYVAEAQVDLTGLPDDLSSVVRECLALDPGARPQVTELLERFTFDLAEMPTAPEAGGWLPAPWTRIIEGHARQGRELAADPRAALWVGDDKDTVRLADGGHTMATRPLPAPAPAPAPTAVLPDEDAPWAATTGPGDPTDEESPEEGDAPTKRRPGAGERFFVRSVQGVMATVLLAIIGVLGYAYLKYGQDDQSDKSGGAFDAIGVGACVPLDLDPGGRWLPGTPTQTNCTMRDARWRVAAMDRDGLVDRCGGPYGAVTWMRTSSSGTASLCLERVFHQGECVLGAEPLAEGVVEVTPLVNDPVFATTVNCSDSAPAGRGVLRVVAYGPSDAGCPAQTPVHYKFPERGRLLCLAPA
ncbi:serine/threonine protein kinase [Streptomyces lancefieldiae]|uniref:mitogen-activated protein kinase kinase n=1 Tax=Streptomyces lancefieldiae TaxID=3075520 RepID=A0ABU3AZ75_9ACTN|nr:serine/threonine-protein kinase [Streptomyces sp. DSM 40712]MDT0614882.1 serine/threonine-protein kinase [Streptomyces sp. DSM 40712]